MINFLNYWKLYLTISVSVIVFGLFAIWQWGYIYSIDFIGGTNLEYQFEPTIKEASIQKALADKEIEIVEIEKRSDSQFYLRLQAIDEQTELNLRTYLESENKTKIEVIRSETVGPVIGAETLRKTASATAIAIVGILLYVAYAFRNFNFAVAAIVALFHDALVVVGLYSALSYFFGAELDTLFVTALLTTMSFSVHDTIVVFDQIRDYRKRFGTGNIEEFANKALTDTMVRSLNNSFTIMFMLLALVLLGGNTIRFFAITLLIGTITGTYSSPFVATPIAVWLEKVRK
ncbi:protein translocase subunit SecF [Candidatus Roizmanbacteria bacterium CG_4_9_14_0_2_um_filter_39_13]|uniref:Protein-export membrane protein SecF n=2 Tax=Candidatus Roizmaniibacteriota TaxID=1752723 RepID=A0A2M8EXR5_9BACT|nr:MAG: protein translocase subunit SecF [Candidatus Roizmanbacteria bacterium CG_4_10_14_0_2_um_filter_39_12]PJC30953.1 MAG: protein translocase subunit SecF [Candidatus Roizmanbacteria bacterium CG_4_9_14_0_2_um_filter_39_13]PJE61262.1 MAG: protein translocase subunit SecF [Candidatus Roizmanbacteria bacterium CG10_big_fil_rev_8_21_14_0_10_39_12]